MRRIVFDSQYDTKDLRLVNGGKSLDDVFRKEHWVAPNERRNEYIGLFVAGLAQLKLLRELRRDEDRLIYCDTDSVMFVSKPDCADPPLGSILGDFSDDLNGDYFAESLTLGKKTYCQLLGNGDQRLKCKGIPKTEKSEGRANVDVMKGKNFGTGPSIVEACKDLNFRRNSKTLTIQTISLNRRISCTLASRVIGQGFRTYPHGYRNIPFPAFASPEFDLVFYSLDKYNPVLLEKD